jgi:hypothetical protein
MALTKPSNFISLVNVKSYGATGDGVTDDTTAIRAAVSDGSLLYFPPGTYLVDPDVGTGIFQFAAIDGVHLKGNNATIKSKAGTGVYGSNTLAFTDCDNVLIEGLTIDCNKANQTGGYNAIRFYGGNYITVRDCILLNAKQDGLYFRGSSPALLSTYPDNILVDNVYIDGAKRNGLSVVGAKTIRITNSSFINTYGESPSAGIDLEPNDSDPFGIQTAIISNCLFEGNDGWGCVVTGDDAANPGETPWTRELILSDCIFRNNGLNDNVSTSAGELYLARGQNLTVNGFLCDSIVECAGNVLAVGSNVERAQLSNLYFADLSHSDNTTTCLDIDSHAEDIRTVSNMYAYNCDITAIKCNSEAVIEGVHLSDMTGEYGITLSGDEVTLKDVTMLRCKGITSTSASTLESITIIDSTATRALRIRGANSTYKDITIKHTGTASNYAVWIDDDAPTSTVVNCILDGFHIWDSGGYWNTLSQAYIVDQVSLTGNFIRNMIPSPLSGSGTWDPASIAAGSSLSTTVSLLRADIGDRCITTHSLSPTVGLSLQGLISFASVTSANTATVTLFNPTGGAINLASHTVTVEAIK